MPALPRHVSVFRFAVLALMVLGMLLRPVLAADCEVRDATQLVASAGNADMAGAETPACGEDCCSLPNCNDCCVHTIALQSPVAVATAVPTTAATLPTLSVDFTPTAFPVAFRPPIAA